MANPARGPYIAMMHGHGHAHHDAHHHSHAGTGENGDFSKVFAVATVLNLIFVAAELLFGFLSSSLALMSDAAHNFSDVLGLMLAWGGAWLARRPPTAQRTYGYRSASILAALANAALVFAATGAILLEAFQRFFDPHPIDNVTVIVVAAIGIAVNAATAAMFMRGRKRDMNVNGAFLHMAADAAVSLGVVIAAVLIAQTGWLWLDPAISVVIAIVIFASSYGLTRQALNLALDAVPPTVDRMAVEDYLRHLPGVHALHDLHIWAMSTTETALTVHLVMPGTGPHDELLHTAAHELSDRYNIHHTTLQIENGVYECHLAPEHVV
jgi:cobalt-zinc-cadmium efflux system protein